ncbi:sensor histidine kinase [Kurthia huakuii]|uniref:sensor histidine kinase n=1 Tax=Kurthia huakuii TaxID=1421019 RepID=UPI0004971F5C|nr:GHKL domain-containing protein [Kurthia huakuii]MBM7699770.1 two-component system sensor histidine kinase AgrC [Kurthia huakuii]
MIIVGIFEIIWIFSAIFFLYNKILTHLQKAVIVVITTFSTFSVYLFFNPILGIVVMFLTLVLLMFFITKKKIIFLDICVILIVGIFSDNSTQFILNFFSSTLMIFRIIIFTLVSVNLLIVYKLFRHKILMVTLNVKHQYLMMLLLFLTMLVLYINIFVLDSESLVKINFLVQVIYLTLITLFISLLLKAKNKEKVLHQKEIVQEQFYEYITALAKMNEDMRKYQHDYMNILLSIRAFIEEENLEGLRNYFYKNILPSEQERAFKNKIFGTIENLKSTELKGIIASKILYAESNLIPVNIEIPEEIIDLNIDILDFVRVLGIYLDNAIEEGKLTENPQINIAFLNLSQKEVLIIIENKVSQDILNIDMLFKKGYSTKGTNRGLGLHNARNILYKYNNVICNTRIEKNYFIQEIQILN